MTVPVPEPADLAALREGRPPPSRALLEYLEAPAEGWTRFLRREHLDGFIAEGGTKVKLLIGTPGSGKSHLLALSLALAEEAGYLAASLNAFGTRLFPIDRFYGAVAKTVGLGVLEEALARGAVEELGFTAEQLPAGGSFLDSAVRQGLGAEATLRRSLRERIDLLLNDPELDPTFAVGVASAVGHRLGVFHLHPPERDALARWFVAEKVTLSELRPLQLFERADRYTGRDYLRSLARLAKLAGFRGLVVGVDNMETVAHRSPVTGAHRYTRAQRDEAYETLRQLIDDVDRSRSSLYLFAGRREFLEDERSGISSYEALRLRLLQEIRARRFDPFADIVDLNAARASGYLSSQEVASWLERVREVHGGTLPADFVPPPHLSLRDLILTAAAA